MSHFTQGWEYYKTHSTENVYDAVQQQSSSSGHWTPLQCNLWVDGFVAHRTCMEKRELERRRMVCEP
jgi:hypothetical protein